MTDKVQIRLVGLLQLPRYCSVGLVPVPRTVMMTHRSMHTECE